ncbi:MAG TPA: tetratricopeptide repeat protein [Candidatus Udaeobacter sp.]|nr:tetratricopeptide repeat protein [Candidatus Udaeobacter sp.]
MNRHVAVRNAALLALSAIAASVVLVTNPGRAFARTAAPAHPAVQPAASPRPAAARPADPNSIPLATTTPGSSDANQLRLGRATLEIARGNLSEAVENLEAIDFSSEPSFPEGDRAAFLLGQMYLEMGSRESFEALAHSVSTWRHQSLYTRWLAFQLRSGEIGEQPGAADSASSGDDATDALEAALRLRAGHPDAALALIRAIDVRGGTTPFSLEIAARARRALGLDDGPMLEALSSRDTTTALGRDLAAAALIARATRELTRGRDPRALLESVPTGSRYRARAMHMLGMADFEHGDSAGARLVLESVSGTDTTYASWREVERSLAGLALDHGDWNGAWNLYRRVDDDWSRHQDALERLTADDALDSLWVRWTTTPDDDALLLDGGSSFASAMQLVTSSLDLGRRPDGPVPLLTSPVAAFSRWAVIAPSDSERDVVAHAGRSARESASDLIRARWAWQREREQLDGLRRYLEGGLTRTRHEEGILESESALLDSLQKSLASLRALIQSVHDESKRRVAERTAAILERCTDHLLWLEAMKRFHLDGPNRERSTPAPQGYPLPDEVVATETALARAIMASASALAAQAPGLIDRSDENAWRPGLIDRVSSDWAEVENQLMWARALHTAIDSSFAAAATSDTLRLLAARIERLTRETEARREAYRQLARRVARAAVSRTLAALAGEREGIDYGLAVSAYGASVHLVPGDTLMALHVANPQAPDDSSRSEPADSVRSAAQGADASDPETARWRQEAIDRLGSFLARHPRSFARGEMRFRLADLLIVDGRQKFEERMAAYLKARSEGGAAGPLPVLGHDDALALYRKILAEDRDFAHRDAVLFNAGMILAEQGSPEAAKLFAELTGQYPASRYVQESYVRMGDMAFADRRYAECVPLYRRATQGSNADLRTVAFYKMGWAEFNRDQFLAAADAFRSVLDLYASDTGHAMGVDVRREAETYLVHSLAEAGGAEALAGYFDRIGSRDYERRVLLSMGQEFRRYGKYPEAIAVDELALTRYPLESDALISAERLVETYQRWNRPAGARDARLNFAPRFSPGSDWARAQRSDSVRAAGSEFARSSIEAVALEHHLKARESGSRDDWRAALDLYGQLLAKWPDDPSTQRVEMEAGEASTRLGEYATAMHHYTAAAGDGRDSVSVSAMWQRVAVADAWYESTRPPGHPRAAAPRGTGAARAIANTSLGSDSLAHLVIRSADELLDRAPSHPASADLTWRAGNLAFAHGWLEDAANHFGLMLTRAPGDRRASRAAVLRADAWFGLGRYADARGAYEQALTTARAAGVDSVARRAAEAIPVCAYREAEAAVAADSTAYLKHAELYETVATNWPGYRYAARAQYLAGLDYRRAGKYDRSVRAMQSLIQKFPQCEYVRDAHLEIAKTYEASGDSAKSAEAYADFAAHFPADSTARNALLRAADLFESSHAGDRAETLRLEYLHRYPGDFATAMEILEPLAVRDLASVTAQHPISTLLPAVPVPSRSKSRRSAAAVPSPSPSRLAEYLRLASAHPDLESHPVLAQVRFLEAEEAYPVYDATRLRQPLAKSIALRQQRLDRVLGLYRESMNFGVTRWAHASACRMGEAVIAFGKALEESERPADLQGDARRAYDNVLSDRSRAFGDRAEKIWSDVLRQRAKDHSDDEWIARTQVSLWKRLSNRFTYRPELEFPLAPASPPAKVADDSADDPANASNHAAPDDSRPHRKDSRR